MGELIAKCGTYASPHTYYVINGYGVCSTCQDKIRLHTKPTPIKPKGGQN